MSLGIPCGTYEWFAPRRLIGPHEPAISDRRKPEREQRTSPLSPSVCDADGVQHPHALASEDEIDQRQATAGLEHANNLTQHLLPFRGRVYFMHDEVRNSDVKCSLGKRQLADIAFLDLDAVRHHFQSRIVEGSLGTIIGQCPGDPSIDANGLAGGQAAGSADE